MERTKKIMCIMIIIASVYNLILVTLLYFKIYNISHPLDINATIKDGYAGAQIKMEVTSKDDLWIYNSIDNTVYFVTSHQNNNNLNILSKKLTPP